MHVHTHKSICRHTVITENLGLLCFFLLSGVKPNSQSAFGSGNLFLLWELCPVRRLECAYMVGKLKPGREQIETDVQNKSKKNKIDTAYVALTGNSRRFESAKKNNSEEQPINRLMKQIYRL